MTFDEKYFTTVNYIDYLKRGGRYVQLADEIMTHLKVHNLDKGPILDFGCAVGLLLDGLREIGYNDLYGVDISDWAVEQAQSKGHQVNKEPLYDSVHGVTFALDVLEHMSEKDLDSFMVNLQTKVLVYRIPIRREEDDDYFLECSRADPTHTICWTKKEWNQYFKDRHYVPLDINLHTIYNGTGVYSGIAINHAFLDYFNE